MKNKLFKQKSMTIWAKNFVKLCRQKDLYTYKKLWKGSFRKTLNCDLEPANFVSDYY